MPEQGIQAMQALGPRTSCAARGLLVAADIVEPMASTNFGEAASPNVPPQPAPAAHPSPACRRPAVGAAGQRPPHQRAPCVPPRPPLRAPPCRGPWGSCARRRRAAAAAAAVRAPGSQPWSVGGRGGARVGAEASVEGRRDRCTGSCTKGAADQHAGARQRADRGAALQRSTAAQAGGRVGACGQSPTCRVCCASSITNFLSLLLHLRRICRGGRPAAAYACHANLPPNNVSQQAMPCAR